MGRREAELPDDGSAVRRFAAELRELRRAAGSPSYRLMAQRAHYSATTLSVAASGHSLPTLPVTLGYVTACGGDPDDWQARWQSAAASSPAVGVAVGIGVRIGVGADEPAVRSSRAWLGAATVLGVVAVVVLVAIGAYPRIAGPGPAGGAPAAAPSPAAPGATGPGPSVLVNATIGADCPPGTGTVRVYTVGGPWSVGTRGGWTGDRCAGEFYFSADPGGANHIEWSMTDLPDGPMDCLLSIFVPDSPHAAGTATYQVTEWVAGAPRALETRVVAQAEHHGDWVGTGPYRVTGRRIGLDLHTPTGSAAEIAAGAVHLYCTPPGQV